MRNSLLDRRINEYTFGAIQFKTRGAGLFFPSDALHARMRALSADERKAANHAAAKLLRTARRLTKRYADSTRYGSDAYDAAAHDVFVAQQIEKATR